MNLIKYSPKWKELEQKDPDGVKLIVGYIKTARKGYTPYVIAKIVMCYWNEIKILKVLRVSKRYHPWIFRSRIMMSELDKGTELSEIFIAYTVKNIGYKIILMIPNILYIHIYPLIGQYQTENSNKTEIASRKEIYTKFNSKWKLKETKDLQLNVNIYKSGACFNSKCEKKQAGSHIKLSLRGNELFEGEIKIHVTESLFNNVDISLSLLTWSERVKKQGYTVCKECTQCYDKGVYQNGWIFVE